MSQSVAGQIRIDLIAQSAQFKAGMRDGAREGFGAFQQEAQKFDRWFNSQKPLAERIQKEKDAWNSAMKSLRPEVAAGGGSMLPWYGMERMNARHDVALGNQTRWKSMVPWGMTMRTELSREAAETAARIGAEGQKVASSYARAMREIAGASGAAGGLGGVAGQAGGMFWMLKGLGGAALANPAATAALAVGTLKLNEEFARAAHAREVGRQSAMLGQGVEDTSRMMGVGFDPMMLSRFQRVLGEQTPEQLKSIGDMGLDAKKLAAEPLKQALGEVAAAFDKLKSPVERSTAAQHLFGRAGAEVIAVLKGMKTNEELLGKHEIVTPEQVARTKAWDNSLKGAKNTWHDLIGTLGGEGTGTNIMRRIEAMGAGTEEEKVRMRKRQWQEDYNRDNAAALEKERVAEEKFAEAQSRRLDLLRVKWKAYDDSVKSATAQLNAMRDAGLSDEGQREKFMQSLPTGTKGAELLGQYDYLQWEKRKREMEKTAAEARRAENPRGTASAEFAEIKDLRDRQLIGENLYQTLRMKHLRDYYREAAGLETEQLRKQLLSPFQRYLEEKAWRDAAVQQGVLSPELAGRAQQKSGEDLRRSLGVKDPMGDYAKSMRELYEAFSSGKSGITREQFDRRRKELRRGAVGESLSDMEELRPAAAIGAGSREFHSQYVQRMLADPKVKLAQDTLNKLNEIDGKLAALVHQGKSAGNPLDE
jgi:hypothetical protein